MIKELLHITTSDNVKVALWKIKPKTGVTSKHVFLTHGTFSNKKVLLGIASYLVEKGHTCWLMEWRNHGNSSKTKQKFNFETIAKLDVPAVFNYLFEKEKIKKLDCITHSGGGIVLSMFLIKNPSYISKIDTITLFGCQVCGAATSFKNRFIIKLGKSASKIIDFFPAKTIGSSEHNESYYTMKQWFDWNLDRNFYGENQFNYGNKLAKITIPILSVCAKGDVFIAPKKGCESFLDSFQNSENKLLYCAKEKGFLEDYTHGRMILSKNAKKEIYPIVLDWIKKFEVSR